MKQIGITKDEINLSTFLDSFNDPSHGAACYFFGKVRDNNDGLVVSSIDYDCFIPLTEKTLNDISSEATAIYGKEIEISIIHRIGRLNVGDISIAIGVSSPHRDESFKALRFIIEEIKVKAPIWKKEFHDNGKSSWVEGEALIFH